MISPSMPMRDRSARLSGKLRFDFSVLKRDFLKFEYTKLHGDTRMIRAKLEGDRLPLPKNIIQRAGLKDGDEVEVRLEDGKVVIRLITTKARFIEELRGCVESSKIDPLEVKRIWKA